LIRDAPRASERHEEAVRFLLERGLDEYAVRVGSMPEDSLEFVSRFVRENLRARSPVRALQIGNFLGVSLCHLTWAVRELHPSSVVVSIDPNQPHMGVEDPEAHARALLKHFGLLDGNLIIRGYTMEGPSGAGAHGSGVAEHVLESLGRLCHRAFDLVLIDGNHEERYLSEELAALRELLADRCIVVFDDIVDFGGVATVFKHILEEESVIQLGQDGRVGIVQIEV